jgi:hypothetical protein
VTSRCPSSSHSGTSRRNQGRLFTPKRSAVAVQLGAKAGGSTSIAASVLPAFHRSVSRAGELLPDARVALGEECRLLYPPVRFLRLVRFECVRPVDRGEISACRWVTYGSGVRCTGIRSPARRVYLTGGLSQWIVKLLVAGVGSLPPALKARTRKV